MQTRSASTSNLEGLHPPLDIRHQRLIARIETEVGEERIAAREQIVIDEPARRGGFDPADARIDVIDERMALGQKPAVLRVALERLDQRWCEARQGLLAIVPEGMPV
jgi:hypothetical protein